MHSLLAKRIEVPENWFDALMFAFKLPTVILPVWLLVWYAFLPAFHTQATDSYGGLMDSATDDFVAVAFQLSAVLLLAAAALIVGGLIQLFRYSSRSAGWSLGFGVFALVIGIALTCASSPEQCVMVINTFKSI
ncbi:MAG TPA: hypothetical protein VK815_02685 [Candidatus Acidoferrales bacterium]|nr:hypothetical protein [Candidatus Acidoferrales bacterium]